jgi:hypothetical protein
LPGLQDVELGGDPVLVPVLRERRGEQRRRHLHARRARRLDVRVDLLPVAKHGVFRVFPNLVFVGARGGGGGALRADLRADGHIDLPGGLELEQVHRRVPADEGRGVGEPLFGLRVDARPPRALCRLHVLLGRDAAGGRALHGGQVGGLARPVVESRLVVEVVFGEGIGRLGNEPRQRVEIVPGVRDRQLRRGRALRSLRLIGQGALHVELGAGAALLAIAGELYVVLRDLGVLGCRQQHRLVSEEGVVVAKDVLPYGQLGVGFARSRTGERGLGDIAAVPVRDVDDGHGEGDIGVELVRG